MLLKGSWCFKGDLEECNSETPMSERQLPSVDELGKITLSAQSLVERALQSGKLFSAGTGRLTLDKGKHLRLLFSNPKGSTRYVRLFRIVTWSSILGFLEFVYDGTSTDPLKEAANRVIGAGVKAVAQVRLGVGSEVLSGRNFGDSVIPIPAGTRQVTDLVGLQINPEHSMGFDLLAADKCDVVVSVVWAEEDIP